MPTRASGVDGNWAGNATGWRREAPRRQRARDTGKPEPIGGKPAGWWSRRINREHRLVYRVTGKAEAQALEVAQCRYHY